MLTRLLGFVPSSRRNSRRHDGSFGDQYSTVEEQHTRSLLFPDIQSSFLTTDQPSERHSFREAAILAGYPFDQDPPDLSSLRPSNIRILLARDDGFHRTVLFDSDTVSGTDSGGVNSPKDELANSPGLSGSRNSPSAGYFESPPDSMQQLSQSFNSSVGDSASLLTRIRSRGASISSTGDYGRTIKANNELNNLLDCAFGNITLNYLGPSTKIHMLPKTNDRFQPTPDASVLVSRLVFLPHREVESTQKEAHGHAPRQSSSKTLRNKKFAAISIMIVVNLRSHRKTRHRKSEPVETAGSLRNNTFVSSDAMNSLSSSMSSSRPPPSIQGIVGQQGILGRFNMDGFDQISAFIALHWHALERSLTTFEAFIGEPSSLRLNLPPFSQSHTTITSASSPDMPYKQQASDGFVSSHESRVIDLVEYWKDTLSHLASIHFVVSGQEKWGKWRDESRIVHQASLTRLPEQFFKRLLTCFLAHHTDWVKGQIAGLTLEEESQIRHLDRQSGNIWQSKARTVILCRSPASARRLLYYLSSFLPHKPIDRRPSGAETPTEQVNLRVPENTMLFSTESDIDLASLRDRQRKDSMNKTGIWGKRTDVSLSSSISRSPSTQIELFGHYDMSRNSTKLAGPSTVTQNEAVPFVHLSTHKRHSSIKKGADAGHRRASSDASTRLTRALHFTQSVERASSLKKDKTQLPPEAGGKSSIKMASPLSPLKPRRVSWVPGQRKSSTLEDSLQDTIRSVSKKNSEQQQDTVDRGVHQENPLSVDQLSRDLDGDDISIPAFAFNLSLNEGANVYDIEFPMSGKGGDGLKSTDSATEDEITLSSPTVIPLRQADKGGHLAAGYLTRVCAEVSLQAVPPYDALERDVKNIMSHEPTPLPYKASSSSSEAWIDVCRFIIADADEGSVHGINLRRLVSLEHGETIPPSSINITARHASPDNAASSSTGAMNETAPNIVMRTIKEEFVREELAKTEPSVSATIDRLLIESDPGSRRGSVRADMKSDESLQADSNDPEGVPRNECSDLVKSMLETILTDAVDKFNSEMESSEHRDEVGTQYQGEHDDFPVQQEILRILHKHVAKLTV